MNVQEIVYPQEGRAGATPAARRTARRATRLRRWARWLLASLLVVVVAGWLTSRWIDSSAARFLDAGSAAVATLDELAAAVRGRDIGALEALYAPGFHGGSLGLGRLGAVAEKDGVRISPLVAGGPLDGRAAALDEWRGYLGSFSSIGEAEAHLHLLERWDGDGAVATVRFELIGTPRGAPRPGIDRALFRFRFERDPAGSGRLAIAETSLIAGDRTIAERPQFVDVAAEAGVGFENRYYPAFLDRPLRFAMLRYGPAGITAADVDRDGWTDLFIPDGVESRLFRNTGDGRFEDITERSGLAGLDGVSVGVFADYDNDGFEDFFVSRTFEPNRLFHNDGDGTFTDVTEIAGIGADCCTTVAAWGDYDLDGLLDLYVGRYLDPREQIPTTFYARNGEPNQLYRNRGDGTFERVTETAGVGEPGLCLGAVWGDYDADGDPDLYVVNDFGRNTLYRNDGDGAFTDVTVDSNTLAYGAGMSASFGDFDNDLDLDLYVANIRSEHRWFGEQPVVRLYLLNSLRQGTWRTDWPLYAEIFRQSGPRFKEVFQQMGSGNTLLANRGDGTFEDVTWAAGANPPGWFWGSSFVDLDNDGRLDVYSANGWVYGRRHTEIELDFFTGVATDQRKYKSGYFFDPGTFDGRSWHGWERNRHLRNEGDGRFVEIGQAAGTGLERNSRGVAVADFWNRGVEDLAVAGSTDRHALLRNEVGGGRHWLGIELTGAAGDRPDGTNRDAVGARVVLRADGLGQLREVVLGDGYGSQSSLRQHFGLGGATVVDELTVTWPRSGATEVFRRVPADRIYRLTEGSGRLETYTPGPPAS